MRNTREVLEQVGRHAHRVAPEQTVKQTVRARRSEQRPVTAELGQMFDAAELAQHANQRIQADALDLDVER
jgi:hypothetical protein